MLHAELNRLGATSACTETSAITPCLKGSERSHFCFKGDSHVSSPTHYVGNPFYEQLIVMAANSGHVGKAVLIACNIDRQSKILL